MKSMANDLLIFIPTYNERENVAGIVQQIFDLGLAADILFVDDNSPDGTGKTLGDLAKQTPNVFVQHQPGNCEAARMRCSSNVIPRYTSCGTVIAKWKTTAAASAASLFTARNCVR